MKLHVYVPSKNGDYKEVELPEDNNGSFDSIGEFLGYTPDKTYCYYGFLSGTEDFDAILFKKLSKSIIGIISRKSYKNLKQDDVNRFMKDFDYNFTYGSISREEDLEDAIKNGTYSKEFICDVLDLPYEDFKDIDILTDLLNGFNYKFENGVLVGYNTLEGVEGYAKQFKEENPQFFQEVYDFAKENWGDDEEKVLYYVNGQLNSFAKIGGGFRNEILPLFHIEGDYVYNFKILDVISNNQNISLDDFLFFTNGDARLINERESSIGTIYTYVYKNIFFMFTEDGTFIKFDTKL